MAALTAFTLTGGADLGAGVWHLLTSGPRGHDQRAEIERCISRTWIVNHLWLLLIPTILFIGFPKGFSVIMTTLLAPMVIILVAFAFRASAFVARRHKLTSPAQRDRWGWVFGLSSFVAPLMVGMSVGAVASGAVDVDPTGRVRTDYVTDWLAAFPLAIGFVTAALYGLLAAVYLTVKVDDDELRDAFRSRALGAAAMTIAFCLLALLLAKEGAPLMFDRLTDEPWSIPFHIFTATSAIGAIRALLRRSFRVARILVIGQTLFLAVGWGAAQYPHVVKPQLTFFNTAASDTALLSLVLAMAVAAVVLVAGFWYLGRAERSS